MQPCCLTSDDVCRVDLHREYCGMGAAGQA